MTNHENSSNEVVPSNDPNNPEGELVAPREVFRVFEDTSSKEQSITLPLEEYIKKNKKSSFILGALTGTVVTLLFTVVATATFLYSDLPEVNPKTEMVETTKEPAVVKESEFGKLDTSVFTASPKGVSPGGGLYIGTYNEGAPTIEIYADPQCPYCKKFHDEYGAALEALSSAGYLNVILMPMEFLGEDSRKAVNAWACTYDKAGTKGFTEIYNELYKVQDPAKKPGQYGADELLKALDRVGINDSEITECVTYNKFSAYSSESNQRASVRGVQGTPTVIDGDGNRVEDIPAFINGLAS